MAMLHQSKGFEKADTSQKLNIGIFMLFARIPLNSAATAPPRESDKRTRRTDNTSALRAGVLEEKWIETIM